MKKLQMLAAIILLLLAGCMSYEEAKQLADGDEVILTGSVEEFNGRLNYKVMAVSMCKLIHEEKPKVEEEKPKATKKATKKAISVVDEEGNETVVINERYKSSNGNWQWF